MPWIDREQLGPQFRFWLLHVTLTAAPSFFIALIAFNTPMAILAMLPPALVIIVFQRMFIKGLVEQEK